MKMERAIIKLIQRGSKKRLGSSFFLRKKIRDKFSKMQRLLPRKDYTPSFIVDDLNAVSCLFKFT